MNRLKSPLVPVLLVAVFAGVALIVILMCATAPVPYRVEGVVQAINREKNLLTLAPDEKGASMEFEIRGASTRLRYDGEPAMLDDLKPGQRVSVRYQIEEGRNIAIKVKWKSSGDQRTPNSIRSAYGAASLRWSSSRRA